MAEPVPLTLAQRKKLLLLGDVHNQRMKQLREMGWKEGAPLPPAPSPRPELIAAWDKRVAEEEAKAKVRVEAATSQPRYPETKQVD